MNFSPKEVLFDRDNKQQFNQYFGDKYCTFELDDWVFTESTARQKLLKHFGTQTLKGFGIDHLTNGIIASGAIMQYLEITQHTNISHITSISRIEEDRYVRLDKFTIRSLELINSMHEGGSSLLNVIDNTITPMGSRMLKRWLVFPLKEQKAIEQRLNVVEHIYNSEDFEQVLSDQLHRIGDLERIISRVAVGRVSPREVVQLRYALDAIEPIKAACVASKNASLVRTNHPMRVYSCSNSKRNHLRPTTTCEQRRRYCRWGERRVRRVKSNISLRKRLSFAHSRA